MGCIYIAFVVFAVSNTVTGFFVDQAIKSAQDDASNVLFEEADRREHVISDMRAMFFRSDTEGTGHVTYDDVVRIMKDPTAKKYLRECDIASVDIMSYFELAAGSDRKLSLRDIDTFVRGCFRLKGVARSLDIVALSQQHIHLQRYERETTHKLEGLINKVEQSVQK